MAEVMEYEGALRQLLSAVIQTLPSATPESERDLAEAMNRASDLVDLSEPPSSAAEGEAQAMLYLASSHEYFRERAEQLQEGVVEALTLLPEDGELTPRECLELLDKIEVTLRVALSHPPNRAGEGE